MRSTPNRDLAPEASSCPGEERLECYLAALCPADEAASVRVHVENCPECAAWLSEASADEQLLGDVRHALASKTRQAGSAGSSDFRTCGSPKAPAGERAPIVRGYQIVGRLGEGGMGIVFEAQQEHPRREVALKVVRSSRRLSEMHRRLFQREADALARLKHDGIASIYHAGHTEDGDPFFAMELVRGVPLGEYVRVANPTLRARLELFRQIADAIHYAHQRGVIHRDLKPSNILVVDEGIKGLRDSGIKGKTPRVSPSIPQSLNPLIPQPKILDFGLARITEDDLGDATSMTDAGRVQGTLPYMSPEQARGDATEIDARSDVYALGVILYELLSGELPYAVSRRALHEAVKTICEQPPQRPSRIVAALAGDLDAILLKVLEKDPGRRYASAAALSDDIQRHLHHQPVLARPPTLVYQLGKLVRRHRVGSAFAATLAVLLVGFGITMTFMYGEADRLRGVAVTARGDAERAADEAGAVNAFLQRMLASADPELAATRDLSVREMIDAAVRELDAGSLAAQPLTQAAARTTIGKAYQSLGLYDAAEAQIRAALELRSAKLGDRSAAAAASIHDLAGVLHAARRHLQAKSLFQDALELRRALFGENHAEVAESKAGLAAVLTDLEEFATAEQLLGDALAFRRTALGEGHPLVAQTLRSLATICTRTHRVDDAEKLLQQALEILNQNPATTRAARAETLFELARLHDVSGDAPGAIPLYHEALDLQKDIYGSYHPRRIVMLKNVGMMHYLRKEFTAAAECYADSLAIHRKLYGDENHETAMAASNLALCYRDGGAYERAEPLFLEAVETSRRTGGAFHADLGTAQRGLAQMYSRQGRHTEAEPLFREILGIDEKRPDGENQTAISKYWLGGCLMAQKRFDEAEPPLLASFETLRNLRGPDDRQTLTALQRIVQLYEDWDRQGDAARYRAMLPETASDAAPSAAAPRD